MPLIRNPLWLRPPQDVDVLAVLDFQIPCFVLRLLLHIPKGCSPTKAVDEN